MELKALQASADRMAVVEAKDTVTKDKAKSIDKMSIEVFKEDELKALLTAGDLVQKLIVRWCLNTAHGAAELGRVTWEDLYLNQDHPWPGQGLNAGGDWISQTQISRFRLVAFVAGNSIVNSAIEA